jgi:hypothetical protein
MHHHRFVLPENVASAAFLSPEERQALQAELGRHHHRSSSSGGVEEGSSAATPAQIKGQGHLEQLQQQGELGSNGDSSKLPPAPAPRQHQRRRRLSDDWASLRHALRCPIVWCSGMWRMLYACAIYGLTYFVPLIIKTILNKASMGMGRGRGNHCRKCGCAALWQCAACCLLLGLRCAAVQCILAPGPPPPPPPPPPTLPHNHASTSSDNPFACI